MTKNATWLWFRHKWRVRIHKVIFHKVPIFERWHSVCYFGLDPKQDALFEDGS